MNRRAEMKDVLERLDTLTREMPRDTPNRMKVRMLVGYLSVLTEPWWVRLRKYPARIRQRRAVRQLIEMSAEFPD